MPGRGGAIFYVALYQIREYNNKSTPKLRLAQTCGSVVLVKEKHGQKPVFPLKFKEREEKNDTTHRKRGVPYKRQGIAGRYA
jgi:hypothetical protein